jgi:hypothetical protein
MQRQRVVKKNVVFDQALTSVGGAGANAGPVILTARLIKLANCNFTFAQSMSGISLRGRMRPTTRG